MPPGEQCHPIQLRVRRRGARSARWGALDLLTRQTDRRERLYQERTEQPFGCCTRCGHRAARQSAPASGCGGPASIA